MRRSGRVGRVYSSGWTLAGGLTFEGNDAVSAVSWEPLRDIDSFPHPLRHTDELPGGFALWLDDELVGPALNIEPSGVVSIYPVSALTGARRRSHLHLQEPLRHDAVR